MVCLDDLSTGSKENVAHLLGHDRFSLVVTDVSEKVELGRRTRSTPCATWPRRPRRRPTWPGPSRPWPSGSEGTRRLLELARAHGARFLLASTSEVYGDPEVHPQVESYWGNVNPIGPRSVYDEAKRFAESLTMAMHRTHGVDVGIVRIFNTYGPRLSPGRRAGRVQLPRPGAARRAAHRLRRREPDPEPLLRRRRGRAACSPCSTPTLTGPVNIGNPDERTVLELAHLVLEVTGSSSDDRLRAAARRTTRRGAVPTSRWPGPRWAGSPRSGLREGIERTIEYFARKVKQAT